MGRLTLYATLALHFFVAGDFATATLIASSEVEKCIEDGSASDPDSVLQECDQKIVVALSVPSSQVLETTYTVTAFISCYRRYRLMHPFAHMRNSFPFTGWRSRDYRSYLG